jgi:hypothetical protein
VSVDEEFTELVHSAWTDLIRVAVRLTGDRRVGRPLRIGEGGDDPRGRFGGLRPTGSVAGLGSRRVGVETCDEIGESSPLTWMAVPTG